MKSVIKKVKEKKTQYEIGVLYIQKTTNTVVLCDRNDNMLRGIVIVAGIGCDYIGCKHFVGEYRADWANTFTKFDGEITLIQ